MKLTMNRMVGWRTPCLRGFVVIFGLIVVATISAQESKPAADKADHAQDLPASKQQTPNQQKAGNDASQAVSPLVQTVVTEARVDLRKAIVRVTELDAKTRQPIATRSDFSGVRLGPGDGLIVTLMTGTEDEEIKKKFKVRFTDRSEHEPEVIDRATELRLTVLNVPGDRGSPSVSLTKIRKAKKGDAVVAVPSSPSTPVLTGHVTEVNVSPGPEFPKNLIQTDISLPPGERGGLLVSDQGEPVGIWCAAQEESRKVSFAIPLEDITHLIDASRFTVAAAQATKPITRTTNSNDGSQNANIASDSKVKAITGAWSRAEGGTFAKHTVWSVQNRDTMFFVECPEGNGLLEWLTERSQYVGYFTFDAVGVRTAQMYVAFDRSNDTNRLTIVPFEDQRKQLLRSGFAKTERELDTKLSSEWNRVEAPNQPMPAMTVAVVKTQLEPHRVRDSVRSRVPYRVFSNDTFRSVIVIAPADAQDEIEALIHQLDVDEPEKSGTTLNAMPATPANEQLGLGGKPPAERAPPGLPSPPELPRERTVAAPLRQLNTPEARKLSEYIVEHETKARLIADEIRSLSKTHGTAHAKVVESQRQLNETLGNALAAKFQLEQLQITSMEEKLAKLKTQIGQRQAASKQIVGRRARELIEGEALKWDASDTNPKNELTSLSGNVSRIGVMGSGEQCSLSFAPQPIDILSEFERQRGIKQGAVTGIYAKNDQSIRIVVEPINGGMDPPKDYPLMGKASLHRLRYRCTISFKDVDRSQWPIEAKFDRNGEATIYFDTNHFHASDREKPSRPVLTTQILITGPKGVEALYDEDFGNKPTTVSSLPLRRSFVRPQGEVTRHSIGFKNVPNHTGTRFLGVLELYPEHPTTADFLAHNAVPFVITDEDFDQAVSKTPDFVNPVTKIVYMPNPFAGTPADISIETLVSTRLDPKVDPIEEAKRRGSILAVFRIHESGPPTTTSFESGEAGSNAGYYPPTPDGPPSAHAERRLQLPSETTGGHPTLTYQEFAKKLATMDSSVAEAEEALVVAEREVGQNIVTNTVPRARRHLDEAIRNRKAILDEYAAVLRDLELQVESARVEADAAKKDADRARQLVEKNAIPQQKSKDAQLREKQSELALERLKVRYELYKAVSKQIVAGAGDSAKTSLPTPQEIDAQLEPIARRVNSAASRVRTVETQYLRDRSSAVELTQALKDLQQARSDWSKQVKRIEPSLNLIFHKYETAKLLAEALNKRLEAVANQLAEGKATEAEVNAVAEEHKRTSESLVTAEALIESYRTASEAYEDIHTSDAEVPTCQEPIHNARTDLGHDPDVALAWLEAATGLKLEFIRFDDLQLWFKAALRVREASGKHQAGDLIVTLNEHRFDSLDQATEALSRKSRGNFKTIVLRGGLAGHREQAHFNGEPLSGYLRPGDPVEKPNGNAATIPFEVRIRGEAASGLRTAYLLGTCVAPDGLVVIPVLSKSLVPGEPLIPYGKIKGTARVVATDDAHGLTLVKLDSPNQPLFHWWKCHMGSPAKQQRLNCQDENGKPYDVLVSEIGQPLTKPFVGNDAFMITGSSVWSFTPGLALKTVDQELQGITIPAELAPVERKPQDDDPGNRKLAIPAVHIEKMIKDYRKASRKSAEGAAVKLNEPQPTSF